MSQNELVVTKPWEYSKYFLSGLFSGMKVGHPFDTLKVRLQTEGTQGRFLGLIHCISRTMKEEGLIRGLYKGLTPPFFGVGLINMSVFGIFGVVKKNLFQNEHNLKSVCICGSITGVLASVVIAPVEHIKAKLQIQYTQKIYTGPLDCFQKLYKNNGIKGVYNGLVSTMITRFNLFSYFGAQELTKQYFIKRSGDSNYKLTNTQQFLTGAAAGICCWSISFPFDCVKNRIMSQPDIFPKKYPSYMSCVRDILKTEGLKGFGRGYLPGIIRTPFANGSTWLALKFGNDFLTTFDKYFIKT